VLNLSALHISNNASRSSVDGFFVIKARVGYNRDGKDQSNPKFMLEKNISKEAIQKILGLGGNVCTTPEEMIEKAKVTF